MGAHSYGKPKILHRNRGYNFKEACPDKFRICRPVFVVPFKLSMQRLPIKIYPFNKLSIIQCVHIRIADSPLGIIPIFCINKMLRYYLKHIYSSSCGVDFHNSWNINMLS